jgi:hypothetical protein
MDGNRRGGTTIYYTLADTPNVYKTDAVTQADGGSPSGAPDAEVNSLSWDAPPSMVASQPSIQKPADDKVYQYSPTGTLLKTLLLPGRETTWHRMAEVTASGIVVNRGRCRTASTISTAT